MSDVSTTDVVSFQTSDRSILSNDENAGWERPDANTSIFGAGGHEHVLLKVEVNELSRTNRRTRRMARNDISGMEQTSRLALFHKKTTTPAVRKHQRHAEDAVSQAVLNRST